MLDAAAFERLVDGGSLPPTLYLGGADESAKAEALAWLKEWWASRHADVAPDVLRAGEAGVDQVLAAAQGGSLFAPVAMVVVLNVEDWGRSTRTVDAAAEGAARVPPENLLVFVESASDNERKNLANLKAACAALVSLDGLAPEQLAGWGARHLKRKGVTAERGLLEAVLEATRLETSEVFNELDKLAAWAGKGGKVTRADAEAILRPMHGGRLDALARAVAERRGDEAVDQLLRSLEAGEREGNVLFQLQTLVSGAIRLKSQQWGWIRDRENSSRLAHSFSEGELAAALELLYRVERAWKSGRGDVRTLLVRAVIGLTEPEGARV